MRRLHVLAAFVLALVLPMACARVLGIRPVPRRAFPHHAHTAANIRCRQCHVDMKAPGDTGPTHIPETKTCLRCHNKPHDSRPCSTCHGLPYPQASDEPPPKNLRFEHRRHLIRAHGECVHCHTGIQVDDDAIRPSMALCMSCHEHRDFTSTRNCPRCHYDVRSDHVPPPSHVVHRGDWLREHGVRFAGARDLCSACHDDSFCAGCHGVTVPILPERLHFDDPLKKGVHRAGFRSRHSLEARTQPGLCTTCHATGFCEACHTRSNVLVAGPDARSPHPPGWLGLRGERNDHGRAAWRDPAGCASCHSGAGEQLCVGCHRVGAIGGNPHRPGWTSQKDAKNDMPCMMCHRPGQL